MYVDGRYQLTAIRLFGTAWPASLAATKVTDKANSFIPCVTFFFPRFFKIISSIFQALWLMILGSPKVFRTQPSISLKRSV